MIVNIRTISVNAITGGGIFGGCGASVRNIKRYKHERLGTSSVCWDLVYKSCDVIRLINIKVSRVEEIGGGDTHAITLPQEHSRVFGQSLLSVDIGINELLQ